MAHPICQQVLSSIWCGNLSGWRGSRTIWKLFVALGIFLTMPFLCLIYWIAPKSKVTTSKHRVVLYFPKRPPGSILKGFKPFTVLQVLLPFVVFFNTGRKDTKDSCNQVSPSLCLLFVVSHRITWRINHNGDVSRQFCFPGAEHPTELAPHGLGGR